ncbi:MAG TPA: HD domain-containing protein [Thermoleophilia bacterium]
MPHPPAWLMESALLMRAHNLAAEAHGSQRRATDRRLSLEHVVEVATLLHDAGFDEELTAVGLLHDAVERGTAAETDVRTEMGDGISSR